MNAKARMHHHVVSIYLPSVVFKQKTFNELAWEGTSKRQKKDSGEIERERGEGVVDLCWPLMDRVTLSKYFLN